MVIRMKYAPPITTPTGSQTHRLNGDILVWNPVSSGITN
jgi:hypothetical protein